MKLTLPSLETDRFDPAPYFIQRELEPVAHINQWRGEVKTRLLYAFGGRSMVTGRPLVNPELHEGMFPRRYVNRTVNWHWRIYAGPNLFLLSADEHRPTPPPREHCYWLSCAYWGKEFVDGWIASLPFKVPPDIGFKGAEVCLQELNVRYGHPPWINFIHERLEKYFAL